MEKITTNTAAISNYKKYFRTSEIDIKLHITAEQKEILEKLQKDGFDIDNFISDIVAYKVTELVENIKNPQQQIQQKNPVEQTVPKELDEATLKQLGIKIKNQNGNLIAVEVKKGATFNNKNILKSFGFSWNPELQAWAKSA